jgi:RNA polymerase sigma-70 factor (ECF subfamily)
VSSNALPIRTVEPSIDPDEGVLIRAAQQDPAAFGVLYLTYLDRIYRYLRSRTRNEQEARDLAQQVFLRALSSLKDYRVHRLPFAAWLFRIARNMAIDANRRHKTTITWDFLPDALRTDSAVSAEEEAMRREDVERLREILAELNMDKREMLALRFAAGLTAAEIAATIGKSEAATKKQFARLMRTLREKYHDQSR